MYKEAKVDSQKDNLLSALACTRHPWILRHYLDLLLEEDSPFRPKDALNIITAIGKNHNGRYLAWDFYRNKYQELKQRYPVLVCDHAVPSIIENFNTVMEREEVTFFYITSCSGHFVSKFATQILDKINTNIAWLETNLPLLKIWLKKHIGVEELPRV